MEMKVKVMMTECSHQSASRAVFADFIDVPHISPRQEVRGERVHV
jgi:hypothetical protein